MAVKLPYLVTGGHSSSKKATLNAVTLSNASGPEIFRSASNPPVYDGPHCVDLSLRFFIYDIIIAITAAATVSLQSSVQYP